MAHTACEGGLTPRGPRSLLLLLYQHHHCHARALVRGAPGSVCPRGLASVPYLLWNLV